MYRQKNIEVQVKRFVFLLSISWHDLREYSGLGLKVSNNIEGKESLCIVKKSLCKEEKKSVNCRVKFIDNGNKNGARGWCSL